MKRFFPWLALPCSTFPVARHMDHTVLIALLLAFCSTASAVDSEGTDFVFAFVRNANPNITNQILSATGTFYSRVIQKSNRNHVFSSESECTRLQIHTDLQARLSQSHLTREYHRNRFCKLCSWGVVSLLHHDRIKISIFRCPCSHGTDGTMPTKTCRMMSFWRSLGFQPAQ